MEKEEKKCCCDETCDCGCQEGYRTRYDDSSREECVK